ncbi:MAG: hypothetical protein M1832_003771 [Thelocarpon impressellum]|nr:MAG: hypothetical protein M1832_003771 [Thelocarpon impressellum]
MPGSVIIVGGSLGGLFAGVVLKRLGHSVRILERSPTPLLHHQGAGIVAGSHTQALFESHDDTHRPIAVTSRLRHFLDARGAVVGMQRHPQRMTSWDLLYYVLRANFDGLRSEYAPEPARREGEGSAAYEHGVRVERVEYEGGRVTLGFRDRDGKEGSAAADLMIAADGPSSTLRSIVLPQVQRRYAGYVAWRGTVPEDEVSAEARATFVENFTFYDAPGTQVLCYTIPGEHGTLAPGRRLLNWVWYANYPADSAAYAELMTDRDGASHHFTMPAGKMREELWLSQKERAEEILPPQFCELLKKTETPFVQAITDVLSPKVLFFDNKLLLLGDALAGFRPHTAASTSQAALHALLLANVMGGEMSWAEYEGKVLDFARDMSAHGIALGEQSQFGEF